MSVLSSDVSASSVCGCSAMLVRAVLDVRAHERLCI